MRELSVASAADSFRFLLLEDAFSTSTEGFRRHIWEKRTRRLRVEQKSKGPQWNVPTLRDKVRCALVCGLADFTLSEGQ